jgi:hypothetical protein
MEELIEDLMGKKRIMKQVLKTMGTEFTIQV